MFKTKVFTMIVLLAVFLLVFTACGPAASSGGNGKTTEITLNYTDHDPPGGLRTQFIEDVWIPEIEKQTHGTVKVNANFGGALLSSSEALEGIGDGVADMGMIFPDFYPEKLFGFQIFRLFPKAPEKWENISKIYQNAFEQLPELDKELEKYNQKALLVTVGLPSVFGSTYKLNDLSDLKGKDWRASSRWHLETFKDIGANPVSVPWEDIYTSLSTGVIDGVLTNFDGFHMMKFYESAPEVTVAPQLWWATPFVHTINLDTWNSLSKEQQDGVMKATQIAMEKFGKVYSEGLEKTIEEERAAGANVKKADQDFIAPFVDDDLLNNMRSTWVKEAKNKHGIKDAEDYVNKMDKIMKDGFAGE